MAGVLSRRQDHRFGSVHRIGLALLDGDEPRIVSHRGNE
jgi:hypothetical protein